MAPEAGPRRSPGTTGRGRTVVVTGASSGVGRATAVAFGAEGDRVALIARGTEGLDATAAEVARAGGRPLPVAIDVADSWALDQAAARIELELGPIDVWVNDAMATVFGPFSEIEPEEYRRATEVTYLGAVWGTRSALRRMVPRDRGVIIQVGSALAERGIPLHAPYCGSKHAIRGFTESVRRELREEGSAVRVSLVQLPSLNTPRFDLGRTKRGRRPEPAGPVYQPEVAAGAILWLVENRRRELYVGSPTPRTIWENRIAPLLPERPARRGREGGPEEPPINAPRPGNLFEPIPGDHGAHGNFERRARESSAYTWLSRNRRAVGGVLAGLAGAIGASRLRSR